MELILLVLFVLFIVSIVISLVIIGSKKGISGLKIMLLGIQITLVGGIMTIDSNTNFGGFEYIVVLLGLLISIVALLRTDEPK